MNATGFSPGQVTVNTSNITVNHAVLPLNRPTQAAVDALFAPYGFAPGAVRNTSEIYFQPDGRPFTLGGLNYTGPIMSYDEQRRRLHRRAPPTERQLAAGNVAGVGFARRPSAGRCSAVRRST